jgi:hypothetical protein
MKWIQNIQNPDENPDMTIDIKIFMTKYPQAKVLRLLLNVCD